MNQHELLSFVQRHRWAVVGSVSPQGRPQAALVGVVISGKFEIFFDTLGSSRKAANFRGRPHASVVIGGWEDSDPRTVQCDAVVDEPQGQDLQRLTALYLRRFPEGRERAEWPDLVYFRARPTWLRLSDFSRDPPRIVEYECPQGLSPQDGEGE